MLNVKDKKFFKIKKQRKENSYNKYIYTIRELKMEKELCCNKKTIRGEEEKKIINNRINRIEGQLKGIKKMIAEDTYCNDVLVQLSAIENSIKSLSNHILENHLYSCVTRDLENGKLEVIDELISLFKKFNK